MNDEARQTNFRLYGLLRTIRLELEEGLRDPLAIADDIHSAFGDGRPNGTKDEDEEE